MNKKTLIIILIGFVFTMGASVFMMQSFSKKPEPVEQPEVVTSGILIAASDLSAGTEITDETAAWKEIPKDEVVEGMIIRKGNQSPSQALDKARLVRRVPAGEAVFNNAILQNKDIMSARLEAGMRAVAIEVSASTLAGGFITPGDYVDVIVTFAVRPRAGDDATIQHMVNRFASQIVMRNVKVLAIDQNPERPEKGARVGRTATLEVDDVGARKLMLAGNMGTMSLALRPLGEDGEQQSSNWISDIAVGEIYKEIAKTQTTTGNPTNFVRSLSREGVQNIPVRGERRVDPSSSRYEAYPNN